MTDITDKREVGYARGVRNWALDDDNPELRFPQSARIFAKMYREDSKVSATYKAMTLPIRRANWQLKSNGAPDHIVEHVASDLRLSILGEDPNAPVPRALGRVSFDKHLEEALYSTLFGCMFFEQVYAVGDDGYEHLVKLAPRWPGTIDVINVAPDGGLVSIEQRTETIGTRTINRTVIPVEHLVAYAYNDVGNAWTGTSAFRSVYKNWRLKDELSRIEVIAIDRNGTGVPIYTGTDLTNDPDGDLERGEELARSTRVGDFAGGAIPAGAKLDFKGVSGQVMRPREAIDNHDNQIAVAALANFLNLEGQGGSYALAETQSTFFNQAEQTLAEWLAGVFNQHVIEDLVRIAYPTYDGPCPQVTFDAIGSRRDLSAQDLVSLANAKVIQTDLPLEEHVRRLYSMPAKEPYEDYVLRLSERRDTAADAGVTTTDNPNKENE